MDIVGAIIAGLIGTAVMTALMYMAPLMGMPKMDIVGMLGTMFTSDKGAAKVLGLIIHFMMGAIFAIVYALAWNAGVGSVNALWGLIFGVVHTVAVVIIMPMMMRMHPRPPEMEQGPMTLMGQFMGHMVFGLVVALAYGAF